MAPASVPEAAAALTAANGRGRLARCAMSPAAYTPGTLVWASSSMARRPSSIAVLSCCSRPLSS
jgi:hypothetical protein